MFFLAGILSKVKPAGIARGGYCPACGQSSPLHLTHKYITPHIFFIPTIKLDSSYIATCPFCASVMEVDSGKLRELRQNPDIPLTARDLHILLNNHRG